MSFTASKAGTLVFPDTTEFGGFDTSDQTVVQADELNNKNVIVRSRS